MTSTRKFIPRVVAGMVSVGALIAAPAVVAAPPNPSWTCSAHAATVTLGGATIDPLHANTDPNAACRDDGATIPSLAAKDVLGPNTLSLTSGTAQAQTGLTNGGGPNNNPPASPTFAQAPGAVAQINNTDVNLGGGALHITAQVIRSLVGGQCQGTAPAFASNGQVVGLTINGMPVPSAGQPDQTLDQIFTGLSPLAPIVRVQINKVYRVGTATSTDQSITREAVRIELLTAPGASPLITIVIGSATADRHGAVCANNPPNSPPVNPPDFPPGGNQPGSNGGGVFTTTTAEDNESPSEEILENGGLLPGQGQTANTNQLNGINGSECANLRVFYDLQRRRGGKPTTSGPHALTARFGLRHVVRGYVRNCKGKPVVNGKIDVYNIVHGKRRLIKTGLRTRSGGKFTMITPRNYTSRTIEYTYRGLINKPKVASRKLLTITTLNHRGRKI